MVTYAEFLASKSQYGDDSGFNPIFVPDFLYDFQKTLLEWAVRKGRCAVFADCGLGKTPLALSWAENIIRKEGGKILFVTPLAVSAQIVREGEKFGIQCTKSSDGTAHDGITVTNYERLHYFDSKDFIGVICDESSAIKNYEGKRQSIVTNFLLKTPYRLFCTATAAPNDFIELGTSAEALGYLGRMDMLGRFFKNDEDSLHPIWWGARWRFKAHAEPLFWKWVCSWARAIRKPSDIGGDDTPFVLPPLIEREHVVGASVAYPGELFPRMAGTLAEQRTERRNTLDERCGMVAELVNHDRPALVWAHMNDEANLLEKIIPDARQVQGSDTDEYKEQAVLDFVDGKLRVLITKPKIGAWGLNLQHCAHMTFFPSHSYEQAYQGIRRCWRFGQKNPVTVDIVTTPGELGVLKNLQRKSGEADRMFTQLMEHMHEASNLSRATFGVEKIAIPSWL